MLLKGLLTVIALVWFSWPTNKGFSHTSRLLVEGLKIDACSPDILVPEHCLNTSDR